MKNLFICIIICLPMFFTACYPTGEKKSSKQGETDISSLDKRVSFMYNIPNEYPETINWIECEPMLFEDVDMEGLFFGDDKGNYWKEIHDQSGVLPSGEYYHLYAKGETDNTLVYDAGSIMYTSASSYDRSYIIYASYYNERCTQEHMREIFPDNELENFSSGSAITYANDLIHKIGINNTFTPEVYAINNTSARNIESVDKFDQLKDWNDDYDAYMLVYTLEYQGVSTMGAEVESTGNSFPTNASSKIIVIVSTDGLEFFQAENIMQQTDINDTKKTISPVAAVEALQEYYSSLVIPQGVSEIKIIGPELRYILQFPNDTLDNGKLIPVWTFGEKKTKTVEDGSSISFYELKCIDASSGELY